MINLSEEEKAIVMAILEWAQRMTEEYGSIIVAKDNQKYDWGQALCREMFGVNWNSYMVEKNILIPTQKDLDRALEWEKGDIPEWVAKYSK